VRYLLDTNTCVGLLRSPGNVYVRTRVAAASPADVTLCSVVRGELLYGALRSRDVAKNLTQLSAFFTNFASLPFDDTAADHYGDIRAALTRAGTTIGPNDLMIAAIARANGLTLVSHNIAEFSRVTGLTCEDWETGP
jgi:tRNA(fMet)-specific endonuclease VapC